MTGFSNASVDAFSFSEMFFPMSRSIRIEFEGVLYHIMVRKQPQLPARHLFFRISTRTILANELLKLKKVIIKD